MKFVIGVFALLALSTVFALGGEPFPGFADRLVLKCPGVQNVLFSDSGKLTGFYYRTNSATNLAETKRCLAIAYDDISENQFPVNNDGLQETHIENAIVLPNGHIQLR